MPTWKEQARSEHLVLQYRDGDNGALPELVAIWERQLFYYIRRLVDSEEDAWDLLQEVWCRVVRSLASMRDPAAVPAWLYQIARNVVRNHLRGKVYFNEVSVADPEPTAADDTSEPWTPIFDAEELHWGLQRISVAHREALVLHFLEGFSLDDIARILEIPAGTVKSRLHHAKKALRHLIDKERHKHE